MRRGCRTIIGGHGGHGKTTMALRMLEAICTGGEFLGFQGMGGKALIIDVEQGLALAQRRILETFYPGKWESGKPVHEIAASLPTMDFGGRCFYCDWPEGVELDKPSVDVDVVEFLIEQERPDVVCFDPIYKSFLGNPNEHEIIMGVIHQLDRLRQKYGFALLIPMHPRKPPAQGGGSLSMHDLYGAAAWSWWAETIVMLKRTPGAHGAILRFEKDRHGDLPTGEDWNLIYDERDGFTRRSSDMGEDGGTLPSHVQVWNLLQQEDVGGLVSRDEISRMLGMPPDTVLKATRILERRGSMGLVVEKGARGVKLYGFKPVADKTMDTLRNTFGDVEEDE